MFSMIKFDVYVSGFMNTFNHTHLVLTEIGRWVSLIGDTAVVAILGVIISLWLATQKEWRLAIITFLTVGSTGFSLVVLKGFFMRARPDNALLVIVNGPSFPSGHAAMAAAFFVVVAYLAVRRIHSVVVRKLVIVGCVLATLAIGLSRVILNVHWVSDVVAGWLLGIFLATASILLVRYATMPAIPAQPKI